MKISKEDIQKLRGHTSAGVMDCKKALQEAKGDFDKAVEIIHEKGTVIAEKKGGRKTGAGILVTYIHNERVGVLLELRSETDFVARSEPFRELAHELVMQIAAMDPKDVEELLKQPYIKDESLDIVELIKRNVAKTGENIELDRFCRYEL